MHTYMLYRGIGVIKFQLAFIHQTSAMTGIVGDMKDDRNQPHAKRQIYHEDKNGVLKERDSKLHRDAMVKKKASELEGGAEQLFKLFQVETNNHQQALQQGT